MPQNYKLGCQFAEYPPGSVVPAYAFAGHDLATLEDRGLVAPTDLPVNVEVRPPAAPARTAPEHVYADRSRLARETDELARANTMLAGRVGELEKHREGLKAELGKYAEENNHLRAACEDHQAAIAAEAGGTDKETAGRIAALAEENERLCRQAAEAEGRLREAERVRGQVQSLTAERDEAAAARDVHKAEAEQLAAKVQELEAAAEAGGHKKTRK